MKSPITAQLLCTNENVEKQSENNGGKYLQIMYLVRGVYIQCFRTIIKR